MAPKAEIDTTCHGRRLERRLGEDAEFRAEFERQRREVAQIDSIVQQLDELRERAGMSKAELARAIRSERDYAKVRALGDQYAEAVPRSIAS